MRVQTKVSPGGRIVVPAQARKALGLKVGDSVLLECDDRGITITPRISALREAQSLVKKKLGGGASLAEELIRERRREAGRE